MQSVSRSKRATVLGLKYRFLILVNLDLAWEFITEWALIDKDKIVKMKILKESNKAIVKTIEQKIKTMFSWKWPLNIKRSRFKS